MDSTTELDLPFIWIPRTVGWILLVLSGLLTVFLIQISPVFYLILINALVSIASTFLISGIKPKFKPFFKIFLVTFGVARLINLLAIVYLLWIHEHKDNSDEERNHYTAEVNINLTLAVIYGILSWIMDKYWKEIQKPVTNSVQVV